MGEVQGRCLADKTAACIADVHSSKVRQHMLCMLYWAGELGFDSPEDMHCIGGPCTPTQASSHLHAELWVQGKLGHSVGHW